MLRRRGRTQVAVAIGRELIVRGVGSNRIARRLRTEKDICAGWWRVEWQVWIQACDVILGLRERPVVGPANALRAMALRRLLLRGRRASRLRRGRPARPKHLRQDDD
jgi:hypothetical protein